MMQNPESLEFLIQQGIIAEVVRPLMSGKEDAAIDDTDTAANVCGITPFLATTTGDGERSRAIKLSDQ